MIQAKLAAVSALLLTLALAGTASAASPTATLSVQTNCSGWTVWADYSGFTSGDVISGTVLLANGDGAGFAMSNRTGSGHLALAWGDPSSTVTVQYAVDPNGPIDSFDPSVPLSPGLGSDPATVTATSNCAAQPMVLRATATLPPTDTAPDPTGGTDTTLALVLLGVIAAIIVLSALAVDHYEQRRIDRRAAFRRGALHLDAGARPTFPTD